MARTGLLLLLLFITYYTSAQKEANIWYFGRGAGLDFSSGNPVVLNNGQVFTDEGEATNCDKNGRLLFYTDGMTVYNRNDSIMPNGQDLFGHRSSTQSAIIIPVVNDPACFYIFTADAEAESHGISTLLLI